MGLVFTPEALLLCCTPGRPAGNPTGLLHVFKEDPDPIPSTHLDQNYPPPVRDPIDLHLKQRGVIL